MSDDAQEYVREISWMLEHVQINRGGEWDGLARDDPEEHTAYEDRRLLRWVYLGLIVLGGTLFGVGFIVGYYVGG